MLQTVASNISQPLMTPEAFCYWLQGLFELTPDLKTLNEEQIRIIRAHLGYVFNGKQPGAMKPSISTLLEMVEPDPHRQDSAGGSNLHVPIQTFVC